MSPTVSKNKIDARLRVAVVFDGAKLKPVWFEERDRSGKMRIFIKEICYTWTHMDGSAKIISFSVTDGNDTYELSLNTREYTWGLKVAVSSWEYSKMVESNMHENSQHSDNSSRHQSYVVTGPNTIVISGGYKFNI